VPRNTLFAGSLKGISWLRKELAWAVLKKPNAQFLGIKKQ
jgi:hypothetical protein